MARMFPIILLLTALAPSLAAQTSLDLAEAVRLARERNLDLRNQRIDAAALKRAADSSWSVFFPSLGAGGSLTDVFVDATDTWTASAGVEASASLTLSATSFLNIEKARIAWEQGLLTQARAERALELNVRKAFYALLLAAENIRLQEQTIESARAEFERVQANWRVGRASELDLLQAQVAFESRKPELENARSAYRTQLGTFRNLLGLSGDAELTLSGSLDLGVASRDQIQAATAVESLAVATLRKSLEAAQLARAAAIGSTYAPTLSLSGSAGPSWTLDSGAQKLSATVRATLSFSLDSLLPWSARSQSIHSAQDAIDKLENQLASALASLRLTIENLSASLRQGLDVLELRKLSLSLAEKRLKLAEEAYAKGTKDLLTVQLARDALQTAQLAVLTQKYSLLSTLLDLEDAMGVPFATLGGKN